MIIRDPLTTIVIAAAVTVMLSGCEILDERAADTKRITHDCVLQHNDGTVMRCGQTLNRLEEATDEGTSVGIELGLPQTQ